jgi:anti-sigma factor RsiW
MLALRPAAPCDVIRSRLSEYLDGELAPHDRAEVALHLAACAPCARLALELALVVAALRERSASQGAT